jgi:hypothetical protein
MNIKVIKIGEYSDKFDIFFDNLKVCVILLIFEKRGYT